MKNVFNWLTNPPTDGAKSDYCFAVDGRRGFPLGRDSEIRLCKPGNWTLHKTWYASSAFHHRLRGWSRNRRRTVTAFGGLAHAAIAIPFIFEMIVAILSTKISLYLGTSPLPLPAAPPKVGMWAVLARSAFGIRAAAHGLIFDDQWPGTVVAGCASPERSRGNPSQAIAAASRRNESANASAMV